MFRTIKKFLTDSKGATAIEYALIAALISVAAIAAFNTLGSNLKTEMAKISTAIA